MKQPHSPEQPLHKQIVLDEYWGEPVVPEASDLSFLARFRDHSRAAAAMSAIDERFEQIDKYGARVRDIVPGGVLHLDVPDSLLKVVEDIRIRPSQNMSEHHYDKPEIFDEQAQAMVDQLLFRGAETATRVETPNGAVDIARGTFYFINSPSQKQLTGKPSELLGKGGTSSEAVFRLHGKRVGHIALIDTDRQLRIVSAKIITPGGVRQKQKLSLPDLAGTLLGGKLSPATS